MSKIGCKNKNITTFIVEQKYKTMHNNVIVKQRVNAPVDKVWSAITSRNQMKEWYFDIPDFELEQDNEFNFYEPGSEKKYHHHGKILEIIPEQKLKHTWAYPEFSKDKTIVKWELQQDGEETVVTLTHKGLENLEHLGGDFTKTSFENGWTEILGKSLKNYFEN